MSFIRKAKGKLVSNSQGKLGSIMPVIRSEENEKVKSEGKNDTKADDQGGKTEKEKEKGKPVTHNENACSSSSVSSSSSPCAVDDSDAKWESLLPENYKKIISRSASASFLNSLSKKDLYSHLCNHPIIIDNGNKSFAIDKKSGKLCYMIGAKGLEIEHEEKSECWQWKSLPDSRFSEVAELKSVWFLHIKGTMETKMLSSETTYGVYFVYKLEAESISVFHRVPVELCVNFKGQEKGSGPDNYLDPSQPCQDGRGNGWSEIEMGEFFIKHGDNGRVVFILKEYDTGTKKEGLIVEGIEFRPKDDRN